MHFVCVVGTLLLMLVPYVVSQALNGLRTSPGGHGKLVNCSFEPSAEVGLRGIPEESEGNVTINCTCSAEALSAGTVILLQIHPVRSEGILEIKEGSSDTFNCKMPYERLVVVKGTFLGREELAVMAQDVNDKSREAEMVLSSYPVSIVRKYSVLDTIFIVVIATLVGINTINMGCHLDLGVVKNNLKRPCAIGIGFTSQYIFMPLIAYGIALALFREHNLQLGLFTMGCSPGGGASNFWTLMLEGDASLSVTMTFLSTALALVMMPFWLFTLGRNLYGNMQIRIPFSNIITSLISLIGPLAIGVLIRRFRPKWADFACRLIRPFTVLMMLFIFTFGVYTNLYMFYVMNWRTMLAGLIVPWCGYIFGGVLALISKRTKEQIIAISVETGVQNTGIAIVLLRASLPQPDADLASVLPVCGSIMLFIPLFVWYIGLCVYNRFIKPQVILVKTEEGSLEDGEGETESKDALKIFTGTSGNNSPFPSQASQQELLKPLA